MEEPISCEYLGQTKWRRSDPIPKPKKINDFIRMKKFNDKVDERPTFYANLCKLNQLIEKVKNELC